MQTPGQKPDTSPEDRQRVKIEQEMAKKANQARQAQLKRDADRLLELSTELKQYVDKTNENVLSFEVIKKAEEIEKLARSVKDKMKGS
jgi:IS30 family transposase